MTLKKLAFSLFSLFVLILILFSVRLIWTEAQVHKGTVEVTEMYESVRASEELQIHLLSHNRESFLYEVTKNPTHDVSRVEAEQKIREAISHLKRHAQTQANEELFGEVIRETQTYLTSRNKISEAEYSFPKSYQEGNRYLRSVHTKAAELTESQLDRMIRLAERNSARARSARVTGMIIIGICFLLLPVIGWIVNRWVYRPMRKLSSEIRTFQGANPIQLIRSEGLKEIREVSDAFNDLIARISDQKNAQIGFIAGVAHDLKNPLGAIRMSADLLMDESIPQVERNAMLQIIFRQVDQLIRMVGDLLDSSRIESGHLELKKSRQNLLSILQDAVLLHQKISDRHDVILESSFDRMDCDCDPTRIGQVVNNLLSNAIKYSPKGGWVKVHLTLERQNAVIRVSDEGIGIGPSDQMKIFEPFRRTKSTKETIPGVGLGLSVSKRIVEAHGGKIEIESHLGRGTTFVVKLPLEELPRKLVKGEHQATVRPVASNDLHS